MRRTVNEYFAVVAQLVRAGAFNTLGCGFESRQQHYYLKGKPLLCLKMRSS